MLKFPRIEGDMGREIRATILDNIPPQIRARGDMNMAFDIAVHAVNEAFASAEATLGRMDAGNSDMTTRAAAFVIFMQIMEAQVGAAKDAMTNVFARLAMEAMLRRMGMGDTIIATPTREG